MRDIYHDVLIARSVAPRVASGAAPVINGAAVDMQGFEGALLIANLGVSADGLTSSLYFTVKFQESDNGTDFTDIAGTDLIGGGNNVVLNNSDSDDIAIWRGYKGSKRYLRIVFTGTGTHTTGTPVDGVIVLGVPRHAPTTGSSK